MGNKAYEEIVVAFWEDISLWRSVLKSMNSKITSGMQATRVLFVTIGNAYLESIVSSNKVKMPEDVLVGNKSFHT